MIFGMNIMRDKAARDDNWLFPALFFLLTIITRIPFTSKLLYHMDSVQFALALEKFDITTHQPHPPGYFLYVMLGRLFNLFIKDANSTFLWLSIIFSGLTVVAIYFLGKELFDKKIGILAGMLALTSPNIWFHGEVALSYIVEAFFSTAVALLCWRLFKGEHKYILLSAIVLGISGGIRQNTIVFLLPLWFFSIKGAPIGKSIAAFGLLGIVCLLWFIPMVWMTGGWNAYHEAFRELWLFNTGTVSVFAKGWSAFARFFSAVFVFTIYGIGAGAIILGTAVYSLIRRRRSKSLTSDKAIFFSLWVLPSVFFYLLIFIHPANPGYALIFLPAVLVLAAASIKYMGEVLKQIVRKDLTISIVVVVIVLNSSFFLFSTYPVSYGELRNHDRNLSLMLDSIRGYEPSKTAIFAGPHILFGFRQIMYYLPEYRTYQVDIRMARNGERRKTFWGVKRETFVTDELILPEAVCSFIIPLVFVDRNVFAPLPEMKSKDLSPEISIASGDVSVLNKIFPNLRIRKSFDSI